MVFQLSLINSRKFPVSVSTFSKLNMTEVLARIIPASLADRETQALILAGICFIGTWVVVTKVIQFVLSMIWPFILLGVCLTLAPSWTNSFISEVIPEYMRILTDYCFKVKGYLKNRRIVKPSANN